MQNEDNVSQFFTKDGGRMPYLLDDFTCDSVIESRGVFHLVRAQRYGRWWVLKGLKPEHRGDDIYEDMLRKEFDIAITLRHENVVETVGFECVPGLGNCIVMEWVDGVTLAEWLASSPSRKLRMKVLHELMAAVEYVHSHQVVHRDIKPSNILITHNGSQAKLIDFGVSDTDGHWVLKQPAGTVGYVSPEQQSDDGKADVRNDIYSLGCVMQKMRLGWCMARVAKRCKSPIEKRYASVASLRTAVSRARTAPFFAALALLFVATIAAIPPAIRIRQEMTKDEAQLYNDKIQVGNIYYWINHVQKKTLDVTGAVPDSQGRVVIPDHVIYNGERYTVDLIGDYALNESGARDVSIPPTVGVIGIFAFYGCEFTHIVFPESVYSVLRGALSSCTKLESVEFGSQMSVIDIDALNSCESLRHITIHTLQPPVFGSCAGLDYSKITLHVPAESVELYKAADEWKRFGTIVAIED